MRSLSLVMISEENQQRHWKCLWWRNGTIQRADHLCSNDIVDFLMAKTAFKNREVVEERKKYGAKIVTSIRDSLTADKLLAFREMVEQFGNGYGTIHRQLTEICKNRKYLWILNSIYTWYMLHVAAFIIPYPIWWFVMNSFSIKIRAPTNRIVSQFDHQWYERVFR